ncbi:ferredoxin [Arthrobacter sp. SLBN-100]|nr:ferredoxin [Arthrobacter sp. SLBN-100]
MKVVVDYEKCNGYGTCSFVAPAVFDLDAKGKILLLQEEISDTLQSDVAQAVRECPEQALSLEA